MKNLSDCGVELPDKRNTTKELLAGLNGNVSRVTLGDKSNKKNKQGGKYDSQAWYVEPQYTFRVKTIGNNPQKIIHNRNDKEKNVNGQTDGNGDSQTGQKNLFYSFIQSNPQQSSTIFAF